MTRRHADQESEIPIKMTLVTEADAESDFPDPITTTQHGLGMGHAEQHLIAMGRNTQGLAEQSHEMELAELGHGGKIIQMDPLGVMRAQMGDRSLDGR